MEGSRLVFWHKREKFDYKRIDFLSFWVDNILKCKGSGDEVRH